nr:hypothetical protein [Chloroflexaceae bacterium]
MVPLRLQSLPETIWRRYTQVHTQRATSSLSPRRLVWSYFCIAIGGLYLLLMWFVWLPFEPSAFWTALHSMRGFVLVWLGVWIVRTSPWRATTPLERRQGQAVATLCLICAVLSVAIALHDREGQQLPWRHTFYWGTSVVGLSQFYWLARQGLVRLSASLFIVSLLVFQLGNS